MPQLAKRPRLKLSFEEYNLLRDCVLERDNWRCQECGSMKNLQIHHMKRRSQLGGDTMPNLITLCANCHGKCHGWGLRTSEKEEAYNNRLTLGEF